uniref:Glycosyltransferase family 92 protein n=1 Tax=Panagrolaimus sp. ES5 TaxID=591445 RepID=A0AC34FMB6_9BILA
MILLLNAHKETNPKRINFQCFSKNETFSQISDAQFQVASYIGLNCLFDFFIIKCQTVQDPIDFSLTTSSKPQTFVNLEYNLPVYEKYPVVMCYPPMVYESRWQQIIFGIEIYKYYGADMQIQYVNSAMQEIYDLLEIYEKKGIIRIEPFAFVDFDIETIEKIGINPMLELDGRNLPLALTDCLMKYRESAEYIIIADVDDILFPQRTPLYNEFSYWNTKFPTSSAFIYYRSYAKVEVGETFDEFSLEKTIKSLQKVEKLEYGKAESAEYIIIADVDDILFPQRTPLYNEFSYWNTKFPTSSAFIYYRSYAKVEVGETFDEFSLEKTIKSLQKVEKLEYGKAVYQTKYAEAAWIHWPAIRNNSGVVPPKDGRILHVQIKESAMYTVTLNLLTISNC